MYTFRHRALFALFCFALPVAAVAQEPTRVGAFTIDGFLDGYYQFDANQPRQDNDLGNSGRLFDTQHNSFTLAAARLNLRKAPTERDPVGLTVQWLWGANADLLHTYDTGGVERYKNLQQVYGTYAGRNFTADVGKFAAWIGYEALDSIANENYSRAFNFNLGQPNYTAGLRVSHPFSPQLTGTVYVANGYNETEDGNGRKTLGASAAFAPGSRLGLTLSWWGGPEGGETKNSVGGYGGVSFAAPGTLNVNTGNLIATYSPDSRTRFAFDGYYTDAADDRREGGKWNGQAVYARRTLSPTTAAALRVERFEDADGLRTGDSRQLHSVTATYEYRLGQSLTNRVEFRQDFSSDVYFGGDDGPRKSRSTLTYGAVYRF
ncbi:MAG: outer membrane beta-barrel protein [Capsulimonadales bacterium]|nr:outer membrane beta-barrel protein [Capsulimonadales bacterium]